MMLDLLATFSSAQAVTVTAASTSVIDTLAAGDAIGAHSWLHVLCNTTFAGQGATTIAVALETSVDEAFTTPVVLFTTAAVAEGNANLTAGGVAVAIQIPLGVLRYLRVKYTIASGPMTAGKMDARIVSDVDRTLDKIL